MQYITSAGFFLGKMAMRGLETSSRVVQRSSLGSLAKRPNLGRGFFLPSPAHLTRVGEASPLLAGKSWLADRKRNQKILGQEVIL